MIREMLFIPILAAATYTDLKERKIPNKLLLCGIAIGILYCFLQETYIPLILSAALLLLLLFLLGRSIGGGDIKLLSLIPFYTDSVALYYFVLSASYLVYFYSRKEHRKEAAFAPVILISYVLFLICKTIKQLYT